MANEVRKTSLKKIFFAGFFVLVLLVSFVTVPSQKVIGRLKGVSEEMAKSEISNLQEFLKKWGFIDPRAPYLMAYLEASMQFYYIRDNFQKTDALGSFYQLEAAKGRLHFSEQDLFKLKWFGKKELFDLLAKRIHEIHQFEAAKLGSVQSILHRQNVTRQNAMASEVYKELGSKVPTQKK